MLEFGWVANEIRETIYYLDSSLAVDGKVPVYDEDGNEKRDADGKIITKDGKVCRAPDAAVSAWREDGDASHLREYCVGEPTIMTYRNLSLSETKVMQAFFVDSMNQVDGWGRATIMAFRIGVGFPGVEEQRMPDGTKRKIVVNEKGIFMLAEPFVNALVKKHPGIVNFYGGLIIKGSVATETEKKASSPPSTPTP